MRIILALFLAFTVLGQSYEAGSVLGWETAVYSEGTHHTINEIIYRVKVGERTYKVSRHDEVVEMQAGDVRCRVNKKNLYVVKNNGKEKKFEIVAVE